MKLHIFESGLAAIGAIAIHVVVPARSVPKHCDVRVAVAHVLVWSDEICVETAVAEVRGPLARGLVQDVPPRPNPNPGTGPVPPFATATAPKTNLAPEFVVGGKGAANVFDGNQI